MVRFGIMGAGNISHKFCDAVSFTQVNLRTYNISCAFL